MINTRFNSEIQVFIVPKRQSRLSERYILQRSGQIIKQTLEKYQKEKDFYGPCWKKKEEEQKIILHIGGKRGGELKGTICRK